MKNGKNNLKLAEVANLRFSPALFRQWLASEKLASEKLASEKLASEKLAKKVAHQEECGRLVVDLGSGSGGFLLAEASAHQNDLLVGFEVRLKRLLRSQTKFHRVQLQNVQVLYADGLRLAEFLPPRSVDLVLIQFPDPWPKAKHRPRRLLDNQQLQKSLEWVCKPNALLALRTDSSSCFLHALQRTQDWQNWQLDFFSNNVSRDGFPASPTPTEFQLMFQSKKLNFYSLGLRWKPSS